MMNSSSLNTSSINQSSMTRSEHINADTGMLSGCEDADLVTAAKAGDRDAFAELVARHRRRILVVAERITNNHADAEDVFQTACMQAFVHLRGFDGRSTFSTWMTRITINTALMLLRRNRAHAFTSMDDLMEGESWRLRDPKVDVWAEIQEREFAWQLESAIGKLQPRLRTVIQMQRQHQGSIKQTAELSGITLAAAKSRLFRARRELRRRLQVCA